MDLDRTDRRILIGLLKDEHVTFRHLQKTTSISPRILNEHLTDLEKRKYVVKAQDGSRALGYDYSLTVKGRQAANQAAIESLEEGTRVLSKTEDIFRMFIPEPGTEERFRKKYKESMRAIWTQQDIPEDEKRRETYELALTTYGRLNEIYRALHKFLIRLRVRPEIQPYEPMFIGLPKGGGIYTVRAEMLRKEGILPEEYRGPSGKVERLEFE
jgi:predicted ArsR family transcriptional regulator